MIIINLYNFLNSLDNSLEKHSNSYTNSSLNSFIDKLKERIDTLEKMKSIPNSTLFSLDRYEGNFGICENISTGELINIPKGKIDSKAKDGDILIYRDNFFEVDYSKTNTRIDYIKELTKDVFDK